MAVEESYKQECIDRLTRMVALLGFRAEVTAEETPEGLVLDLKTSEAGRLIGRKGHCLQALELLLERMLRKQHAEGPELQISIDGYRNPRERGGAHHRGRSVDEERLRHMAEDAAKEVKRWGEERRLGPLNAAERRIVHMTLRADAQVRTESEAPDPSGRKCVVVRLAQPAET
jgi:spoIIIJ-associated protein